MKHVLAACACLAMPIAANAASVTYTFDFAGPTDFRGVPIFDFTPGDGQSQVKRDEVSLVPVPFAFPRFTPLGRTLTRTDVTYRLGDLFSTGQNSVFANPDGDCGMPGNCVKELGLEAVFTYGVAIEGVLGTVGNDTVVDGLGFDVALSSGFVSGDSATGRDGTALSGFQSGDEVTRSFTAGQSAPFIGVGNVPFNAFNAAAVQLVLDCIPAPGPVTTCAEDATVFMTPDFEVELTYFFDEPTIGPSPVLPPFLPPAAPIPLPAGLPLLGGALIGLIGWRRLTNCPGTT